MIIDCQFDAGNIEVIDASDLSNIRLNIQKDSNADYRQWFYFRVVGARGKPCKFSIENAGKASCPEAWDDGTIVVSHDRENWDRIATRFDGQALTFVD